MASTPDTKKQVGLKTGDPETFKNFEELYAAFEKQLLVQRGGSPPGSLDRQHAVRGLPPGSWRSLLTGGCIETGTEVWNGGANYYTIAQIVVGGVDAANSPMAVKHLVFDEKKLTMAELKEALAANFEGEMRRAGSSAIKMRPSMATTSRR